MILREQEEMKRFREALSYLNLTEKNKEIAERYFDLEEAENQELLKEVEHQDFTELDGNTRRNLYNFVDYIKSRKKELCDRYTRFVAEIGGTTAKYTLFRYTYNKILDYLKEVLPTISYAGIRSEMVAWDKSCFRESEYHYLVEIGCEHPEWIQQMMKLCYDDDAANTKMFLTGVYLYCIKPMAESNSKIILPLEEDNRTTDDPDVVRESIDYLEKRLMGNIDGLFVEKDEPSEADVEILKTFVRESDPSEPIPEEVYAIISNRKRHEYRMTFLPFLAFLAIEHSNRFISLIRLAVAINGDEMPNFPLDGCLGTGNTWFPKHMEALEKYLPMQDKTYLHWGVLHKNDKLLTRLMEKTPDAISEVFDLEIGNEHKGYLMKLVKSQNPKLYEKFGAKFEENYRKTIAKEEAERARKHVDEIYHYLMGETELVTILPLVEDLRYTYYWRDLKPLNNLFEMGEIQMYRRALVLECLRLKHRYFDTYWIDADFKEIHTQDNKNPQEEQKVEGILKIFELENVPVAYQLEYFGETYDYAYACGACNPNHISQKCIETLKRVRSTWHQEWIDASKSKHLPSRILGIRVMSQDAATYKTELLGCASEKSNRVKEFLKAIYEAHKEWEADILAMLQSKKGTDREMAAQVLKTWGAENYRDAFEKALEAEKTKKIRTLLQEILGVAQEGSEGGKELSEEAQIKEILTGNWKRKLAWFLEDGLPKVHQKDGELATEEYLAAILISYADMKIPSVNEEAKKLAEKLEEAELFAYMQVLYEKWIKNGAQSKQKWVLYAAAIHGGEWIVPIINVQIQEWPKAARGAIAAIAVKALALNGTSSAFLAVDQLARKCKFRQIKGAAAEALDLAAEQLHISREELEDRIVPNLGFDNQAEQIFDYGTRKFRVVLTPALTLEVYDEKGKQLKNLPSPGKQDDPVIAKAANDAWKLLKKQLKTVIANQKIRLEQTFITERTWKADKWQALFVKNPVMHPFAMGLVWGVYQEGTLTDTFRYMEDGTLNTADEDEYELLEDAVVGLVHPIELSEESLEAWKEQLSDYEIVQPITQLTRPVYRVTEEEKEEKDLIRFGGMVLNGLALSGKLLNMGWYRGDVEDAGLYYSFYRYDEKLSVELEFSGCCVDYANEDVVVYEAYFYKPGNLKKDGYRYVPVREALGIVNARYFSEVVLQLTAATVSSKERVAYPECKRY